MITQNRVNAVKKKQAVTSETDAYYSQIELPGNRILTDRGDILGPQENINHLSPVKGHFYNSYLTSDSLLWYNKRVNLNLYCYNYKTGTTKEYNKIAVHEHFGFSFSNGKIYIANNEGLGVLQDDSLHYLLYPKKEIGLFLMQWQNCPEEFLQFPIVNCTAVILSPALLIHYSICRIIASGLYGSTRIISLLELMEKAIISTGMAR